ncbi:MAG: metal ABC transporter ATP-binding protein [Spirochaetales bacterium]|nr:metal ABC transporter ATP-binding protein [Spirochaetales bacterium]
MDTGKEAVMANKSCGLCCTKVKGITVTQGKAVILNDVSFHIHCGQVTAIVGPNGSGKTTLLKAMLGIIKHQGKLNFLDAKGKHTGKPVIGYVPQNMSLDRSSPVTVTDLFLSSTGRAPVFLFQTDRERARVREYLSVVKADHLAERRLGQLSGGEMQRVLLALALIPAPDLLLLDEPVSALDDAGIRLFYSIVAGLRNSFDLAIVIVSHDLDMVAEYANTVVLLDGKVIESGPPSEVFLTESFIRYFGKHQAKGC